MGNRSITDMHMRMPAPWDSPTHGDLFDEANARDRRPYDGLGDRERSWSPEADHWETLLTTITPDPSIPSAESSFDAAAPSGPAAAGSNRNVERPPRRPISALRDYVASRPGRRPRSPVSNGAVQADDNCPPTVPSQTEHLSFGEIPRDPNDHYNAPALPPPSVDRSGPRARMMRQLHTVSRQIRQDYDTIHHSFADFIEAFSRGERTVSEAESTLRLLERMAAHVATIRRIRRRERQAEEDLGVGEDSDWPSNSEEDDDSWSDRLTANYTVVDRLARDENHRQILQDAARSLDLMRRIVRIRPLSEEEISRRDRAERSLGDAIGVSRGGEMLGTTDEMRRYSGIRESQ